ncbi:polymorphic toxin type 43 domain-containing protein [Streptomyces sp. WAC 06738]|uniref:polymorphic toxin type 43 domain-containing protein n=1 Tax=Streptomyces sp. WAC 06738 TaxID=2203210 RepID=UPI001F0CCADF|nr:polymorphic toxin type 43 domain-containing protein [Streptomyces sp. WAC 06738]
MTAEGPTGTSRNTYSYDPAGNTTARTLGGDKQTLAWDAEGHLAKVTEPDGNGGEQATEYLYDADGNRLIGRTPSETTLYLGHTDITLPKGADKPQATRYHDLGDGHQAVEEDDGTVWFTPADHHATGQLAIQADSLDLQRRRETPFGTPRGEEPVDWPGTRGFVGGTNDTSTGLTHLGAREYDPDTGRFISVDPIMDLTDPAGSFNGYTYAGSSPITFSDPSGLSRADACGVGCPIGGTGPGTGQKTRTIKQAPSYPVYPPVRSSSRGTSGSNWGGGSSSSGGGTTWQSDWIGAFSPDSNNKEDLLRWWSYYGNNVDGSSYWLSQVGENGESSNVCWGRDACQEAWRYLMQGGDIEGAKRIAATYCLENPKGCQVGAGAYGAMQESAEAFPFLLAAGAGAAISQAAKGKPVQFCHSFTPGTKVLPADGTHKDIDDVEIGDKVVVTDPETGDQEVREVVATITTEDDKHFVDLTITTPDGTTTLTATTTHPFWSKDDAAWVDAGDITPGTTLRTPDNTTATVQQTHHYTKRQRTHDLTINDIHTYHVLAGETPVLVHNCLINGSGPAKGILEVSDRVKSVGAVKSFSPKGERDFIFDPTTGRFATGAHQGVGGHDFLGSAVGADKSTMVGGRLRRGPNGELQTNEWSGHYGMNWNDSGRKAFQDFMGRHGITVNHTSSMYW